ncbi:MAG: DNA polymerase III subunit gamma/tau [Porticoccaceae bacterium]
MSYQVLARKWRPRSFAEMVGQEHVLRALINGLDNDRLHHAYLFTGTRGVGKTTIARILAKCLNCEAGISSVPCGQCASCREIAEGRFVDLIEVDAASRTKVEDTRELLDNVQYAPTRGRYKVYLIDEVHMLSTHSFNALLKTLEEPPPHVKFLLATTDPQKLPVTVLSRCLQFNLKNLNPERIVGHLKFVLGEEKIPFEETALWELGRAADGSMRDALSLTDQAIAHGGGALTVAEVNAMLGTIDRSVVVNICQAIANADVQGVLAAVDRLADHAPDYSSTLAAMLSFWHQVAIAQAMPDALDSMQEHHGVIVELASQLSREDVQLFYQITLLGRKDLPLAADPRSGFEMVMLRLLAFNPLMPDQVDSAVSRAASQGSEAAPTVKKSQPETSGDRALAVASIRESLSPTAASKASSVQPTAKQPANEPALPDSPSPLSKQSEDSKPGSPAPVSAEISPPLLEPELTLSTAKPEMETAGRQSHSDENAKEPCSELSPPPWLDNYPLDDGDDFSSERDLEAAHYFNSTLPDAAVKSGTESPDVSKLPEVGSPQSLSLQPSAKDLVVIEPVLAGEKIPLSALTAQNWMLVCQGLGQGGLLQNLAINMVVDRVDGVNLVFLLDRENSALYEDSHRERLAAALSAYFGVDINLSVRVDKVASETPRMTSVRLKAERQQKAIERLKSDANVQELCRVFGAELVESTVKPID